MTHTSNRYFMREWTESWLKRLDSFNDQEILMKNFLKRIWALHVSLAYLSMLTGFGMLLFTVAFFYLLKNNVGLPVLAHWLVTYLMAVIGPGAILLALSFYKKSQRKH